MNSCDLLVHFQGKQDWCALVHTANFESVTVHEVSAVALSRYNSVFHKTFHLMQCRIGVIDDNKEDVQILENPKKEEIKTAKQEIVIILPEQAPQVEHELNPIDYIRFSHQSSILVQQHKYALARECLILAKNVVFDSENQTMLSLKPIKGLTEKGFTSRVTDMEDQKLLNLRFPLQPSLEDPSIEYLVQKCCYPNTPLKKQKEYLREIMKTDPDTALEIAFRNPDLYKFIAKMSEDEKVMKILPEKVNSFCVEPGNLKHFIELFLNCGALPQILFLLAELREIFGYGDPTIIQYYVIFLLTDRQFDLLHEVLMSFFQDNFKFEICYVSYECFYNMLDRLKKTPNLGPIQLPAPTETQFCKSDYMSFIVLLVTAVYFFMKGEVEYFCELRNFIDPILTLQNGKGYLKKSQMVFLFKACQSASYQLKKSIRNSPATVYVVGDECAAFCANRVFEGVGAIDVHIFDSMPLAYLREEHRSPGKTAFWKRIEECEKYETLVLVLGNIDFRTTIQTIMLREFDATFEAIFKKLTIIYLKIIEQIHEVHPKVNLVVHEVFDYFCESVVMIRKFNQIMKSMLPSYVTVVEMPLSISIGPACPEDCPTKEYYCSFHKALMAAKKIDDIK